MGLASAQTADVVDLFLVGFDVDFDNSTNLVASVIASDASATTYSITCASTASSTAAAAAAATTDAFGDYYPSDDYDCVLPDSFTFTQGPSTVHFVLSYNQPYSSNGVVVPDAETMDVGCVLTSSTIGVCSETENGIAASTTVSLATTIVLTNGAEDGTTLSPLPVTITAGNVATGRTATNTASGTTATSSGSSSKGATKTGSSSTSSGTASANASSGAALPVVTAKAQWIVGGAAAALALAAL